MTARSVLKRLDARPTSRPSAARTTSSAAKSRRCWLTKTPQRDSWPRRWARWPPACSPRRPSGILVGARIGDYDIVARLGAGGMGVVYRAKDRRLGRDVAFKVLPTALELDEPRLARFDREARFLAAVNHPHIGSIYGFVEANGIRALALELVEGETLAAVLRRGPIPMERSLVLAAQVADALDHAHRRGVLHRDLKPSNIMLTSGGVKLLDFGVGKWSPKDGESPLPGFSTLTEDGAVVGTIHYMSPEQLEGRTAEARSDLFSFGAVLFEMLAGRMAFDGPSQASIIAAILNGPTPRLPEMGGVSLPRLERVVAKCLAKDPDERWQSARDLGDELRWLADDVARPLTAAAGGSTSLPRPDLVTPRPQKAIAAAAVIATALLGWAAWTRWPAVSAGVVSAPALRFVVQPPPGVRVNVGDFRVSSDGTQLAYSSGQKLYLRRFDRLETIALPGTDHEVINLDFSPDGNWIAFAELRAEGPNGFTLRKVRATGETGPVVLIESLPSVTSMIWPTPDTIFFAAVDHPIQRVFADGGQATPVTTRTESEIDHHTPQLLPGGDALLFAVHAKGDRFSIAVQSLKSGERRTLIESGFAPQVLADWPPRVRAPECCVRGAVQPRPPRGNRNAGPGDPTGSHCAYERDWRVPGHSCGDIVVSAAAFNCRSRPHLGGPHGQRNTNSCAARRVRHPTRVARRQTRGLHGDCRRRQARHLYLRGRNRAPDACNRCWQQLGAVVDARRVCARVCHRSRWGVGAGPQTFGRKRAGPARHYIQRSVSGGVRC